MARVSISPNTKGNNSLANLLCKEYCGGTLAVCYCAQCSAIFCAECFNKEHQSERKMFHEKIHNVRPICEEHHHTLEYFDLSTFLPLCIMCLTRLQMDEELKYHVIQNMTKVSPKLYSLLVDKIREAKDIVKTVEQEAPIVRETIGNTIKTAKDEVHCLIEKFKNLLDEREKELVDDLDGIERRYLLEEETAGLLSLKQRLEDSIKRASNLVQSQHHDTIGYEFPHCYGKLNDLCTVASKKIESKNEFRITVNVRVSKPTLHKMQKLCDVVSSIKLEDDSESDCDVLESHSNGDVKVQIVDKLKTVPLKPKREKHHGNDDNNIDVNVENYDTVRTVTPIGDGDFYDNKPTNDDGVVDVIEIKEAGSEMTVQYDDAVPSVCSMDTDSVTSTPLTSMSADTVRRGRRVDLEEADREQSLDRPKNKRGRKRKVKSLPGKPEDEEWSPDPKRVIRSTSHEKSTSTRTRRGGALINEMNQCDSILTELWADDDSWPFVRLVGRKKCPEYYKKIRNPMSLEIVKEKLHSFKYRSVMEFVKDMDDVFENCRDFNEPESDVYESGIRLGLRYKQLLVQTFPNLDSVLQNKSLMDSSFEP